jgi:hypothetical protein
MVGGHRGPPYRNHKLTAFFFQRSFFPKRSVPALASAFLQTVKNNDSLQMEV